MKEKGQINYFKKITLKEFEKLSKKQQKEYDGIEVNSKGIFKVKTKRIIRNKI